MHRLFQTVKGEEGFSIIEAAVSLIIMGILATASVSVFSRYSDAAKLKETQAKQEKILTVLAQYALLNRGLPRAADPQAGAAEFGTESGLNVGILPYRTLGLPESIAKDAYGNYFTYAMEPLHPSRTRNASMVNELCFLQPFYPQQLKVTDAGQDVAPTITHEEGLDFLYVVLVSHGKNGHGAYTGGPGKTHKISAAVYGPAEIKNADGTSHFINRPYSQNEADYFDDIVTWAPRNQLVSLYGGATCYRRRNTVTSGL